MAVAVSRGYEDFVRYGLREMLHLMFTNIRECYPQSGILSGLCYNSCSRTFVMC